MKSVHKAVNKHVHKVLKLRHHRHSGKLLAHKHTSYRVLFVLMLAPILMMSLVQQLDVSADLNLTVTATVPAPIPPGKPTIDYPTSGQVLTDQDITVSGTCPVITPAIIIVIYESTTNKGSSTCTVAGEYAVPISLGYGSHTLVAKVVTITNGYGQTSDPVTVTRPTPPSPSPSPTPTPSPGLSGISTIPTVATTDIFAPIRGDGATTWKASIIGGVVPYRVRIDWGDGTISTYTVRNGSSQTYTHDYANVKSYNVTVTVVDAYGNTSTFQTVAAAYVQPKTLTPALDSKYQSTPWIIEFIQEYTWQIYIGTLFALIFLWYLQHGHGLLVKARS